MRMIDEVVLKENINLNCLIAHTMIYIFNHGTQGTALGANCTLCPQECPLKTGLAIYVMDIYPAAWI